ncbi:cyclic GMP-AMP synthase [Rhineura floridana]|uniref:cyclic GMP-AMP synthase n=1 Tax=Rhineura floridana TaxID=261503 RepID=UPI002AC804BE|nr:cyclic GMP-AMP synthase [Rhineura floridana]
MSRPKHIRREVSELRRVAQLDLLIEEGGRTSPDTLLATLSGEVSFLHHDGRVHVAKEFICDGAVAGRRHRRRTSAVCAWRLRKHLSWREKAATMGRGGAGRRKGVAPPAAKKDAPSAPKRPGDGQGNGETTTARLAKNAASLSDEGKEKGSDQAGKGVAPSERKASQKKKGDPRTGEAEQAAGEMLSQMKQVESALVEKEPAWGRAAVATARKKGAAQKTKPLPKQGEESDQPDQETACAGRKASRKSKEVATPTEGECRQAGGKGTDAPEKPDFQVKAEAAPIAKQSHQERPEAGVRRRPASQKKGAHRTGKAEQSAGEMLSQMKQVESALVEKEPARGRAAVATARKKGAAQKTKPLPKQEEESDQSDQETACAGRKASRKSKEVATPTEGECRQAGGKGTDAPEKPDFQVKAEAAPIAKQSHQERPEAGVRRRPASQKKGAHRTGKAEQSAGEMLSQMKQVESALVEKEPARGRAAVATARKKGAAQKTKPLPKQEEESDQSDQETACAGRKASRKSKEVATPTEGECRQAGGKGTDAPEKPDFQVKAEAAPIAKQSHQERPEAAVRRRPASQKNKPVAKASVPAGIQSLNQVLEKLKIATQQRSVAARRVNQVRDLLVTAIKMEDCFSFVDVLGTGSYYERVKISIPDEFDIMLKIPNLRIELESCSVGASTGAFYYVKLKRNPGKGCLHKFLDEKERLSSSNMLSALRTIIVEAVKEIEDVKVSVERKRPGSPAVTLLIGKTPCVISVDIILALEFRCQNWCESTKNGLLINEWQGRKVKKAFLNEPLLLVPKNAKDGKGLIENTWRLSFSHIEKALMTDHGHAKTCCEKNGTKCCRKDCLKLLKYLLKQLKTKHENRNQFDRFHSYHAKTAFFHTCANWPHDEEWLQKNRDECFKRLLGYFLDCLKKAELQHFFIPEFNLLCTDKVQKTKCSTLAKAIESEKNNRFPAFLL